MPHCHAQTYRFYFTSFYCLPRAHPVLHAVLQHFQDHSCLKAFGNCCSNILFLQITARPTPSPVTSYNFCSNATFFQILVEPTPSPPSHNLWSRVVFFWLCQGACGILVVQPGTEPVSPALKTQSTSGPPGKSLVLPFLWACCVCLFPLLHEAERASALEYASVSEL